MGVVASLALLELTLFSFYSIRDGEMLSASERFRRGKDTFVAEQTGSDENCTYLQSFYPHPYLGFVHHDNPPCGLPKGKTNNVGLFGRDFPLLNPQDKFVILVSGGSVAAQFSSLADAQPKYLEELLNERYRPPSGSSFLVLNGGEGGWSHPQQAVLFLMYSDIVDAVVTLDGYNEIQVMRRGFRLEFPSFLFHVVNPAAEGGERNLMLTYLGRRLSGAVSRSPLLSRSHTAYFAVASVGAWLNREIEQSGRVPRSTSVETIFSFPEATPPEQRFRFNAAQYAKYIRSMRYLAQGFGIETAHFLQPVPAIAKELTASERSVVGDLSYGADYQALVDRLLLLNDERIPVVSLLDVFAAEKGEIYADQIHCVNERKGKQRVFSRGYSLMARSVARELERAWGLQPK